MRLLALGMLALFVAAQPEPQTGPEEQPAEAPETVKVERGDLAVAVDLEGVFESPGAVEVRVRTEAFRGEMRIVEILSHADAVAEGDILLILDPAPAREELEEAETSLQEAGIELRRAGREKEVEDRNDRLRLEEAAASLKAAEMALRHFDEIDGKHMLRCARLDLERAENSVADQQEELDQLKKMYESEDLTSATAEIVVRRTERELLRLKTVLEMEQENCRRTVGYTHPERRREIVLALETEKLSHERAQIGVQAAADLRETRLRSAERELALRKKRVEELKRDLDALTIKAPAAGVLLYGRMEQGAWTSASMMERLRPGECVDGSGTLMTIVPPGPLEVSAEVEEAGIFEVVPGMQAEVRPAALPDLLLKGRVASVSPITRRARFVLEGCDERLVPGLTAGLRVVTRDLKGVLLVPAAAVFEREGRKCVRLKDGSAREIAVAGTDGEKTAVREGLQEGEEIRAAAEP